MVRVVNRRTRKNVSEASVASGVSAKNTPEAVATPFPPPLKRRKIGLTWPWIAARPHANAHPLCGAKSNKRGNTKTGRKPFAASSR